MSIGQAIAAFAKDRKLTKYRISKESNISQTTLGEIVNEKNTNPTIDTLEKIANGLGITLSELMKKAEELDKERIKK
ncbi:helix-turn-helix domain-containing protein [Clostridium beijerinckii]|uniref:helix-turn-helix domain-containing protein n=1 Tax=Clostridium beijerinckii TaxID=1520 RepID=UPI0009D3D965|nr:helix-turn-helix transcriptional regulator [Clostridium beijerinckii]MBA8935840.1 transcriptional regulator with XRE-family HTH domain [Clostridium beijerinckii]MBA8935850.1 transcriptional regulator with XRE-family HTH domain [Clostridium beijerinckii]NRU35923.1 transcriptional regulator with XRE-family HTH domain [Clostridium beijerinckii]NRU41660.1 transcriptional regulator with XRE-family HTH domain [Clostridium beijerinckii]NSB00796.1 transcriptional regulator with XRE-family HTH domai